MCRLKTAKLETGGRAGSGEQFFLRTVSGILWLSVAGAMGVLLASAFRGLEGMSQAPPVFLGVPIRAPFWERVFLSLFPPSSSAEDRAWWLSTS